MCRHARYLVALSVWVVAQLAEHRTVTAAGEGSTPFGPPNSYGALGKSLKPPDSQSGDRRFKSDTRCQLFTRNCGREVRHLIVDQADDGSSPFSSAMRQ